MSQSTNIYINTSHFQNTIFSVQNPLLKDSKGNETGGEVMSYNLRDLNIECKFVDSPIGGKTTSQQFIGSDNPNQNSYAVIVQCTGRQPFKIKAEFHIFGNVGKNDKERFEYYNRQKSFIINLLNKYDVIKIENPLLKEAFSKIENVKYNDLRWTVATDQISAKDVIEDNHRPVPMGSLEIEFIEVTLRDLTECIKIEKKKQTVRFAKKVDELKGKYGIKDESVIQYTVVSRDTINKVVAMYASSSRARKKLKDRIMNYSNNSISNKNSAIKYGRLNSGRKGYYLKEGRVLYIPQ